MGLLRIAMAVLVLAVAAGRVVAMLPPETFRDPLFVEEDTSHDGGGSEGEYTEFA